MSTVTHLTHYLSKLDPQKSVARQTFLNFLKVFGDPVAVVQDDLVNQFFSFILNYQYWQTNSRNLGEALWQDLEKYKQTSTQVSLDLSKITFPHQTQFIVLEHKKDFESLLAHCDEWELDEGDRLKISLISEQQGLVVILRKVGGLEVRVFNKVAMLQSGRLKLIGPVTDLKYTSDLDLVADQTQIIEGPMMTAACFKVTDQGCVGVLVRGHLLQRFETLTTGHLHQHSELFYGLKRIERYFINPSSDPYYKDLVTQLERVLQLLKQTHPEGQKLGPAALQKGKAALKNIFPHDKLLSLLITNVEFALIAPSQEIWTDTKRL